MYLIDLPSESKCKVEYRVCEKCRVVEDHLLMLYTMCMCIMNIMINHIAAWAEMKVKMYMHEGIPE